MKRSDTRPSAAERTGTRGNLAASFNLARSASTDKLLELKLRAERAAGQLEEADEVEAGFRAALLEIALYVFFVVIFGIVTWVHLAPAPRRATRAQRGAPTTVWARRRPALRRRSSQPSTWPTRTRARLTA